ncbi:MAG TPA: hypothetical protein VNU26_18590 [Mycobacteriales bacterium]|nr:hypothetical protein [Mycobacteriales bacterium]
MSRSRSRVLAAAAAGALTVGLTACSSGPSKEDYVSSAEQICADANSELEELGEPESPDQLSDFLDEGIAIGDDAVEELENLEKPEGDADELDRIFLEPVRGQVDAIRELAPQLEEAVANEDLEALSELEEQQGPEADLDAMRDYGFDDCVEFAEQ